MPPVSRDRCSPEKHYNLQCIGVHRLYDIRSLDQGREGGRGEGERGGGGWVTGVWLWGVEGR